MNSLRKAPLLHYFIGIPVIAFVLLACGFAFLEWAVPVAYNNAPSDRADIVFAIPYLMLRFPIGYITEWAPICSELKKLASDNVIVFSGFVLDSLLWGALFVALFRLLINYRTTRRVH
jgi:hypothetical protein